MLHVLISVQVRGGQLNCQKQDTRSHTRTHDSCFSAACHRTHYMYTIQFILPVLPSLTFVNRQRIFSLLFWQQKNQFVNRRNCANFQLFNFIFSGFVPKSQNLEKLYKKFTIPDMSTRTTRHNSDGFSL